MNWKFTNIHHAFRRKAGVSLNEYAVLDVCYQSQVHPKSSFDGWCKLSYSEIGDFLGLGKATVHGIVERVVSLGLLEVCAGAPHLKKTTALWYENAYLDDEKAAAQAAETVGESRSLAVVRKMNIVRKPNEQRSETERHRSETERQEEIKKEGGKEVKPKTEVLGNPNFEAFWKAFARKVGKKKAQSAFCHLSKADQAAALNGLKGYDEFRSRPENSYLEAMHPTTYLNGRRWEDEYPPARQPDINLDDVPLDPPLMEKYEMARQRLADTYPALKEVRFFRHSEFASFFSLSAEYLGANWKTRTTERQVTERHKELLAKLNETPYLRKSCAGIYPYLQSEMKKILYQQA